MSKQFSVEVGCKKIPNSKKLICSDGVKRTPQEYKTLKDKKVTLSLYCLIDHTHARFRPYSSSALSSKQHQTQYLTS